MALLTVGLWVTSRDDLRGQNRNPLVKPDTSHDTTFAHVVKFLTGRCTQVVRWTGWAGGGCVGQCEGGGAEKSPSSLLDDLLTKAGFNELG
jgi:hypothetical protein